MVIVQHGAVGAAFARSLFLEYPHLTVCIVHLFADQPALVERVVNEVRAADGFVEVHYDAEGRRTQPVLVPLQPITQREPITLDARDVLLVTGGGKGIAAECSLSLAQDTGVTLALLGRSKPQQDSALREHLARLDAMGVRYCYFPVDILDASAIKEAVHEIEARFGAVTAILHGAGINQPTPVRMLDEEVTKKTIAPKVQGLQNVLAAVSQQRIKSLITFGSVIARTGMHGEAHYALANEWLGSLTAAFQREHPACSCLCIEWSIWAGVGMGERLGSIEALRAEGIMPIPVEEGIALFRQLQAHHQAVARVVVSGRLGTTPTLHLATEQLPFLRFLEKPRVFYPGIELITEVEMSVRTDSYIDEHQLQGERLVPAVIGLEAIAQVAQAVTGHQERPSFHEVQFIRPLVIPEQGSVTLRLLSLVHPDGSVEVAIRCSETSYQVNHFQAVCHFAAEHEDLVPILAERPDQQAVVQHLEPKDIYGSILFHQGRFRRLRRYTYLHAWECVAEISPQDTESAWFARYLPQELILGDPASRDALVHAIQACIPQATLLPVQVEAIRFAQRLPTTLAQSVQVHAHERSRQGNMFIYDMEARDNSGHLLEQWLGLHLQLVGAALPQEQWSEALLGPYLERRINELTPHLQRFLFTMPIASDDPSPSVEQRDVDQENCTIQIVKPRSNTEWHALLKTHEYALAQRLSTLNGEGFDISATCVLAARQLLEAAGHSLDTPMVRIQVEQDGWCMLYVGSHVILTFVTSVRSQSQPFALAFYRPDAIEMERAGASGLERGR